MAALDPVDFWRDQLRHAHVLNALVDNHRFMLMQLFFGFHGLLLSALVFGSGASAMPSILGQYASWCGVGVLIVGLGLSGVLFSQHMYMRSYKHLIAVLELRLLWAAGLAIEQSEVQVIEHRGSLFHDPNPAVMHWERTLILLTTSMVALNLFAVVLTMLSLGADQSTIGKTILSGLLLYAVLGFALLKQPEHRRALPSASDATNRP